MPDKVPFSEREGLILAAVVEGYPRPLSRSGERGGKPGFESFSILNLAA